MPYARFLQRLRVAAEAEAEATRSQLRAAAFTGWLVYLYTPLEKGQRHVDLGTWWRRWGLDPQARELTPEEREAERLKGREVGRRIAEMDRKRKEGRAG